MNEMLVSVITPSFNQGRYIEKTLLSVRGQNYPAIEHIVVDAGSMDGTLDILKQYEGTYNLKWLSESDRGMYDAINKGLRLAKGAVLAYLNTDDCWLPWTVATTVRYFSEHPETQLVFGDHLNIAPNGRAEVEIQPPFRVELYRRTGWSLPQPTVFWKREVSEALGGFDDRLLFCGDWDFWMRAMAQFKIAQMREFLALIQLHPDQKTAAQSDRLASELEDLLHRYAQPMELTPRAQFFELKVYAWFWQRVCTARFFLSYFLQRAGYARSDWANFIGTEGVSLAVWWKLLLGFLPFGHRGERKWVLANQLEWRREGFYAGK